MGILTEQEKELREIPLTRGQIALVDDEDYALVSQHKWHAYKSRYTYYAITFSTRKNPPRKAIRMHNMIMCPPSGLEIDHKNGNGLDNSRENLRLCTHMQNMQNQHRTYGTSKYKGCSWNKKEDSWVSYITFNKKRIFLGYFSSEEEAAMAYNIKAKELFGEFANENIIGG